MTNDRQPAGRTPRRLRPGLASGVRVAAAGSALCLAAGMGISMAGQASAAAVQPGPERGHVLPVCITLSGILRVALPLTPCNGAVVFLEIAEHPQPSGIDTDVHVGVPVTVPATGTVTAEAFCGRDEVATGGGYATSDIVSRFLVLADAPTTDGPVSVTGDTPNDWLVTIRTETLGGPLHSIKSRRQPGGATVTAYVVCTKGPKHEHGPRMAPARSAARH